MDIGNDYSQATVTTDPLKWGWKLQNGQLVAITTDMPAAPDGLLRVVRCNCKTDCSTARCSCRKHGLQCNAPHAVVTVAEHPSRMASICVTTARQRTTNRYRQDKV